MSKLASDTANDKGCALGAVHLLDEVACAIGYRDAMAGRWRFEWGPEAWRAPII